MGETVLVADDDEALAALLGQTLGEMGYHPVVVPDGAVAMVEVPRCRPALIITDIVMPNLDGLALRAALREQGFGETPVMFISSGPCPAKVPAAAFVAKPFDLATFRQVVQRFLPPPALPAAGRHRRVRRSS